MRTGGSPPTSQWRLQIKTRTAHGSRRRRICTMWNYRTARHHRRRCWGRCRSKFRITTPLACGFWCAMMPAGALDRQRFPSSRAGHSFFLVAAGVQVHDYGGGDEAVDAEPVPAAGFEPAAEPFECGDAGDEGEDESGEAGGEGRVYVAGCDAGRSHG